MARSIKQREDLVLGWKLDGKFEPAVARKKKVADWGAVASTELVTVPARSTAVHTCVIAQSGSGKSYFVGRLLEELLLCTRVNLCVIDQNGDYRRFFEIDATRAADEVGYDSARHFGHLPTETDVAEFRDFLAEETFLVRAECSPPGGYPGHVRWEALAASWPELSDTLFHDEQMTYDDNVAVRAAFLFSREVASAIMEREQWESQRDHGRCDGADLERVLLSDMSNYASLDGEALRRSLVPTGTPAEVVAAIEPRVRKAIHLAPVVDKHAWSLYEMRLRYLVAQGVVSLRWSVRTERDLRSEEPARVQIIDVGTIHAGDEETRLMLISDALHRVWTRARHRWSRALDQDKASDHRLPTILVLEEAHRTASAAPTSYRERVARDMVRLVASEGRKYGLALLLVTQRPEKIDPFVLGEIQNLAVMKVGAPESLEVARALACSTGCSKSTLESVLRYPGRGRAILLGKWAEHSTQSLYSAMRRTVEGGRSLKEEDWAKRPR